MHIKLLSLTKKLCLESPCLDCNSAQSARLDQPFIYSDMNLSRLKGRKANKDSKASRKGKIKFRLASPNFGQFHFTQMGHIGLRSWPWLQLDLPASKRKEKTHR